MSLFRIFYNLAIHIYALVLVPKILFSWKKYKSNFLFRLGYKFPYINKDGGKLIWVHAVSLGETRAIAPLIRRLKSEMPSLKVLLSTSTETGYLEGKKALPDIEGHIFFPFDFPYVIRPLVKRIAPDYVMIVETDYWFHFLDAAKEGGAKVFIVNGKFSLKTFQRYRRFPFMTKHLLGKVDHFFLQGELYKERLQELSLKPSRLIVTGNIKLDGLEIKASPALELVLTLGSTHAPEEQIWILALKQIWEQFPDLKVMLVPRHPERFSEVSKLLEDHQIAFGRYSKGDNLENHSFLLVDAMGALLSCYAKSTLAFVGGSFTENVGGHNIIEPCFFGKPVLFGPYMHSQPDFLVLMQNYEAGVQITKESLVEETQDLLSNEERRLRLGENGLRLVRQSRGAIDKTLNHLLKILKT